MDVAHLTATSRNDPDLFGAATDTTTFVEDADHDLSGGGSRVVDQGDVAVHPGTLVNLSTADDRFDLDVTEANLYQVDGLLHPTVLWADTDDDGIPDLAIATDDEGDGTWDTIPAGWDTDGDGVPDIPVSAGDSAAYELRRAVPADQKIQRDHVTLTSESLLTSDRRRLGDRHLGLRGGHPGRRFEACGWTRPARCPS